MFYRIRTIVQGIIHCRCGKPRFALAERPHCSLAAFCAGNSTTFGLLFSPLSRFLRLRSGVGRFFDTLYLIITSHGFFEASRIRPGVGRRPSRGTSLREVHRINPCFIGALATDTARPSIVDRSDFPVSMPAHDFPLRHYGATESNKLGCRISHWCDNITFFISASCFTRHCDF